MTLRLPSASTVLSSTVDRDSSTEATPWANVTVAGGRLDRKSPVCVMSRFTAIAPFAMSPSSATLKHSP